MWGQPPPAVRSSARLDFVLLHISKPAPDTGTLRFSQTLNKTIDSGSPRANSADDAEQRAWRGFPRKFSQITCTKSCHILVDGPHSIEK